MHHHDCPPPDDHTAELLARILAIEEEKGRLTSVVARLEEQLDSACHALGRAMFSASDVAETERGLLDRLATLETENERLRARCVEIEQLNTQLVYLQVATAQLHGTFDRQAALTAIRDIVINLIGSEELAIWGLDEKTGALPLLDSFGVDREAWHNVPVDGGLIGLAALTGEPFVAGRPQPHPMKRKEAEQNLTACIPLKLDGRVVGVVGIFTLLPQKAALEPVDYELFDLLASHGAEALLRSHQKIAGLTPEGWS